MNPPRTGTRLGWNSRIALLSVAGLAIAAELLHALLNRLFDPFDGAIDWFLHVVMFATPIILVASFFVGYVKLMGSDRAGNVLGKAQPWSTWVLLGVIGLQLILSTLVLRVRSGSSFYRPLMPDLFAGLILGTLTLAVGRPLTQKSVSKILLLMVAWLWTVAPAVVDALWLTEGTERGVGPLWDVPILSSLLAGIGYLMIFVAVPIGLVLSPPYVQEHLALQMIWWLLLAGILTWLCGGRFKTQDRVKAVAVAVSTMFLAVKLVEWGTFFAD